MEQFDAIIIGAGPAGMMAAIRAAGRNRKILLVERNDTLGEKLLISGKGRCNLTNSCDIENFIKEFSESRDFLRNAFAKFFNTDLMSFFEDAGLKLKTERGGRVFPQSDKSCDVLNVLRAKLDPSFIRSRKVYPLGLDPSFKRNRKVYPLGLKNKNIKILTGERVREIIIKNKKIQGILAYSGKHFLAEHIAIATGGASYPETGSTGDGYAIARKLGHKIVPLKPALCAVSIRERFIRDWQGISLKNVRLTVFSGEERIEERFGEMLFTHFGLSGPVVLDISASVYDALKLKNEAAISINFKPALDHKILNARLLREFNANSSKSIKNIFKNLLPRGIIRRFLKYCNINEDKKANQITSEERKRLIEGLFDLRLTVERVMPIKDGIVTRGGVDTKEINPKTMESKLVKGLFFAGEVIDIDAKTGGYNMQAAFSTGWVCGDNI